MRDTYNVAPRPSDRMVRVLGEALGKTHPMTAGWSSWEGTASMRQWDTDTIAVMLAVGDTDGRLRRKALEVALEERKGKQ